MPFFIPTDFKTYSVLNPSSFLATNTALTFKTMVRWPFDNAIYALMYSTRVVYKSVDNGLTWTIVFTEADANYVPTNIACNNNLIVLSGYNNTTDVGGFTYTSIDGNNFTRTKIGGDGFYDINYCADDNNFYVAANNLKIGSSINGITFTMSASYRAGTSNHVNKKGAIIVMIGTGGVRVGTTLNNLVIKDATYTGTINYTRSAFNSNNNVWIIADNSAGSVIKRSADLGQTWQTITGYTVGNAITYLSAVKLFIFNNPNGRIVYTTDGITLTNHVMPSTNVWNCATETNTGFLMHGASGFFATESKISI